MAKRIVRIREIPGHPNYFADVYGGVWSAHGTIVRQLVPVPKAGYGYVCVWLGRGKRYVVQYLIALTFLGPRPRGMLVLHGDDDPLNNRLTNLSYGTPRQNYDQAVERGRYSRGEDRPSAKLTAKAVISIREKHATGKVTMAALGRMYGVSGASIMKVVRRERWKHV